MQAFLGEARLWSHPETTDFKQFVSRERIILREKLFSFDDPFPKTNKMKEMFKRVLFK